MSVFDKRALRETLLSLEAMSISDAQQAYDTFLSGAMLDRSETFDSDGRAQSVVSSNLASQLENQLHEHEHHEELLQAISFEPTDTVGPGALVKVNGRYVAVAVPTPTFRFGDVEVLGISCDAPLCKAMKGMQVGDEVDLDGRAFTIEEVH